MLNTIKQSFNSRAHKGRDSLPAQEYNKLVVSIHAPTRGATLMMTVQISLRLFQFTRPQGARLIITKQRIVRRSFNSRAHKGRDKPFITTSR